MAPSWDVFGPEVVNQGRAVLPNAIPVAQAARVVMLGNRLGMQGAGFAAENVYWSLRVGRLVTLAEGAQLDARMRGGQLAPVYRGPVAAPIVRVDAVVNVQPQMLPVPQPIGGKAPIGAPAPRATPLLAGPALDGPVAEVAAGGFDTPRVLLLVAVAGAVLWFALS